MVSPLEEITRRKLGFDGSARRPSLSRVASNRDALQALIIVAAGITIVRPPCFFGLYVTALAGVKIPSLTSGSAGGTPTPTPRPPAGH